jgi:ribonuclease HI
MKAFTDGACRVSNPGVCSCAFAVFDKDKNVVDSGSRYLGPDLHSNNYAEYMGLLDLLKWAREVGETCLEIYCDSKLVVEQSNNRWAVNEPSLRAYRDAAYTELLNCGHKLYHMRGHSKDPGNPNNFGNEYVDALCNDALDKEMMK